MADRPPATCNAPGSFQWAFNSLGQSPCTIAATLAGVCSGGNFTLPALLPTEEYLGPPLSAATACRCSSVYYSLQSACALCQSRGTLRWSMYSTNCTSPSLQTFPRPIPPGTAVPHYAYESVSITDGFDVSIAEADIGDPESTAVPTPTSVSTSGPSSNIHSPGKKSHTGAIAGGVVGGVVFLVVVAGLAFWWIRRRRAQRATIPTPTSEEHMKSMNYNYTASTLPQTPRIYDPSDPSTFPSTGPSSRIFHTAQHTGQHSFVSPTVTGATQTTGGTGYAGMPEV